MKQLYIQNLVIITTDECNYNCKHCMRGNGNNCDISDEIIEKIFEQVSIIGNLCFSGGEPLMKIERIKKIFQTIMDKKVIIREFGLATNGTLYNSYVESLFDSFGEYVNQFSGMFDGKPLNTKASGYIDLSWDIYHEQQLSLIKKQNIELYKQYINNIHMLIDSKHFLECRTLKHGVYDDGRAKKLEIAKIGLKKINRFIAETKDIIYFGPTITISNDGMITECDGSFETLKNIHNYGNINDNNLINVLSNISGKCKTLAKWGNNTAKEADKYYK